MYQSKIKSSITSKPNFTAGCTGCSYGCQGCTTRCMSRCAADCFTSEGPYALPRKDK